MEESTDRRLTRLLMLEAVPYSSVNFWFQRAICSLGGIIKEIMLVPLPRALSKFLINLRIFHISTLLDASHVPAELDALPITTGASITRTKGKPFNKTVRKYQKYNVAIS